MTCGNGVVDPGEQCDDGNLEGSDGCEASCACSTQCPTPISPLWVKMVEPEGSIVYAHAVDASGNIVVAGSGQGAVSTDIFLAKYAPSGDLLWSKLHDLPGNSYEVAADVAIDAAGNVVVAGLVTVIDANLNVTYKAWIAKLAPDGTMAWEETFEVATNDIAYAVAVDAAGDIVVAGENLFEAQPDTSSSDGWLQKRAAGGAVVWTKTYGTMTKDTPTSVAVAASGRVFLAETLISGANDEVVAGKTSAFAMNGAPEWSQPHDAPAPMYTGSRGGSVAVDPTGVWVAGAFEAATLGISDANVRKYSEVGDLLWSTTIPDLGVYVGDISGSLASDGLVVVATSCKEEWTPEPRCGLRLVKVSGAGSLVSSKVYGDPPFPLVFARGVAVDGGGNSIVAFDANPPNSVTSSFIAKFAP